jgi:hypothetical protein
MRLISIGNKRKSPAHGSERCEVVNRQGMN